MTNDMILPETLFTRQLLNIYLLIFISFYDWPTSKTVLIYYVLPGSKMKHEEMSHQYPGNGPTAVLYTQWISSSPRLARAGQWIRDHGCLTAYTAESLRQ